jgi:hypothetical protein
MEVEQTTGLPRLLTPSGTGEVLLRPAFAVENAAAGTRTVAGDLETAFTGDALRLATVLEDPDGRRIACSFGGSCNLDTVAGLFAVRLLRGFVNDTAFSFAGELPCGPGDQLFVPGRVAGDLPEDAPREGPRVRLDLAAAELSAPVLGLRWAAGAGFLLYAEPHSPLGEAGLTLVRDRERGAVEFAVTVPAAPVRRRGPEGWREAPPPPMYLGEGGALALPVCFCLFDWEEPAEFHRTFMQLRALNRREADPAATLPYSSAATLVEENLDARHWAGSFYVSRTSVARGEAPPSLEDESFPDAWVLQQTEGGAALACALSLSPAEATRARGLQMLDFLAAAGVAPSGLFYSAHNRWSGLADPPWTHVTGATLACRWLLEALAAHGRSGHEAWAAAAEGCCEALATMLRGAGDFGYAAARNGEPAVWEEGSAAGALGIACLVLGRRLLAREDFLPLAGRAAEVYAARLAAGEVGGSTPAAGRGPDSRSAALLLDSFTLLYDETREDAHLDAALLAADLLGGWVSAAAAPWPAGSDLGRSGAPRRGAVVERAGAPLAGPGLPGTALRSLLRLYQLTGEEELLELLADVARAQPLFVAPYHAALGELRRGMVAGEVPLVEWDRPAGTADELSRAGPAARLLVTARLLPGVYVDPPRGVYAVFDHLNAAADFEERVLLLANPTAHPAAGRVLVEVGQTVPYRLEPGENAEIDL